jgi:cysteinyl-tRNA synthetase
VHGYAHIGNYRAFVFNDLLRRHLAFSGYRVTQVMNVTDVEDKIIRKSAEQGISRAEFVAPFEAAFHEDLRRLRVQPAEVYPRATEHIPEMVALVERLLAAEHAYQADGDTYFRVASFPEYGRLARLDRAGLRAGARVAQDEYDKESATDFALWKAPQPADAEVGAVWEAPFGRGRPGWHIECSAMSMRYLGETFDIHCGGVDLLFPHHENEIAQSQAATGKPLARFWLHSEHLVQGTGEKMSKSLGNISTLRELVDAGQDPLAIRYFLIANAHYRSKLRLDLAALHACGEQVRRLREFADRVRDLEPGAEDDPMLVQEADDVRSHYRAALDDDLNLPQGLGYVFDLVRLGNAAMDAGSVGVRGRERLLLLLQDVDAHLDILTAGEGELSGEEAALIAEREAARQRRDYGRADEIRELLRERGILVEDSKQGVRWRRDRG